jgi:hypothetical protein
LRSDYWRQLKQKVAKRRGNKCEQCKSSALHLDLHHKHYETFGRERQKDVLLLCRQCHQEKDVERKRHGDALRAWYRLCGEFGGVVNDADYRMLEEIGWIRPASR